MAADTGVGRGSVRVGWRAFPGRRLPLLLLLAASGCANHDALRPAPWGPGAATATDLRPWLDDAPSVTYTGTLLSMYVASQKGLYTTWALTPAGGYEGVEVDVRGCAADAESLSGSAVTVRGRLIARGHRHLPLLVAETIKRGPTDVQEHEPSPDPYHQHFPDFAGGSPVTGQTSPAETAALRPG
jgi:hypothetical protein